ncbi:MAG: hypothetical protein AAF432_11070 [Planctomycetota bacterium]
MQSRTSTIGIVAGLICLLSYAASAMTPGIGGACCLPDGTCEFIDDQIPSFGNPNAEYCESEFGGVYLGDGTNCGPGICMTEACCFTDGMCMQLSPMECMDDGGTPQGNGTVCGTPANAGIMCPQPPCPGLGDCFAPNGTPGCDIAACCELNCNADPFCCEVEWDQICADEAIVSCDDTPGACCLPDGSCVDVVGVGLFASTLDACEEGLGGAFQGFGSACATSECTANACCLEDGTCLDIITFDCVAMGGTSQGAGSYCAPVAGLLGDFEVVCPLPLVACCLPVTGDCIEADVDSCQAAGGESQGVGTFCASSLTGDATTASALGDADGQTPVFFCPGIGGACCLENGLCVTAPSVQDCNEEGGEFVLDAFCDEAMCPVVNDDCEGALPLEFNVPRFGTLNNATPDDELWLCLDTIEPEATATAIGETPNEESVGVWFTVEGTGNVLEVTMCDTDADSVAAGELGGESTDYRLTVFCGTCTNLRCVAFGDDVCDDEFNEIQAGCLTLNGSEYGPTSVAWCAAEGVTYYILLTATPVEVDEKCLDGISQLGGPSQFRLVAFDTGNPCESAVDCSGPGADFCEDAEFICPEIVYEDDTFDATSDFLENGGDFQLDVIHCGLYFGIYDEWYAYRAAWDGMVTLIVEGVDNPTFKWTFGVYPDCKTDETEQIACNELVHTAAFFEAERGEVYYFRVARNNFERGNYRLSFLGPDCAPDAGDLNNNGTPDMQECIEDVDGNGVVEYADFIDVILAFEECLDPNGCDFDADVDGNGDVDPADAMIVFEAIGRVCPADPFSLSDYIDGRMAPPATGKGGNNSGVTLK